MRTIVVFLILVAAAFAQSDRGTITGQVTDPANAAVVGATVIATNAATGTGIQVKTTETGNYTIPQVPAGAYSVTVEQPGFRKYEQKGITIQVAQTVRVDIQLQVGSTSESVTVTADAALLKTDSAENSTVLTGDAINTLPLNFANLNTMRNPLTFVTLAPGTSTGAWNSIRVNGAPENTYRISFEGQDMTNAMNPRVFDEMSPSVDAVQEFAVQSNNYSAEFGQVGGGLLNFTARSGGAQYHGSAYDYFVNEAMNAGSPYSSDGSPTNPKKLKTKQRQMDFGGSLGGPLVIPKLYDGKAKNTFFFFNYEIFRNIETRFLGMSNLPTMLQRAGNFSQTLTTRVLPVKDPAGNNMLDGMIFDPSTVRTVNGLLMRDPFPGNTIQSSRFDPVSQKVQALIPAIKDQYLSLLSQNFAGYDKFDRIQNAPSIKIDQNIGDKGHLSAYYGLQRVDLFVGGAGLPFPLDPLRQLFIRTHTFRVNYDHTITPTLLLHVGVGYQRYINPDIMVPEQNSYDQVKELGLKGALINGFPRLTGLPASNGYGPTNIGKYLTDKPTSAASLTWVRDNHTFKFGGDFKIDAFTNFSASGSVGSYAFSAEQTSQPSTQGQNLGGGSLGNAYASFLLGYVSSASIQNFWAPQYRRKGGAIFVQDSWKVTPKLTLDLGVRWDVEVPPHELWHRQSEFSFDVVNPSAGGLLGGAKYEGYGPGRCNCSFTHIYPYAIGPRAGVAYRIDSKTVFRGGIGFSYAGGSQYNYMGAGNSTGFEFNTVPFASPSYTEPAVLFKNGLSYNMSQFAASLSPGIRPIAGSVSNNLPAFVDRNAGRPPRQLSWTIGFQREITRDFMVEAAYVANRGVWWQANSLVNYNALTPDRLKTFGIDINNSADRTLLGSRVDSSAAVARGIKLPYAGFPVSQTVAQALRPYPQFTAANTMWAPLGNTWYDSLQLKFNKRMSKGLMVTGSYTWSKNLGTVDSDTGGTTSVNDVFNRPTLKSFTANDFPHIFTLGVNYELPFMKLAGSSRFARKLAEGWQLGGMARYQSGQLIRIPSANNNLSTVLTRGTYANRVSGQPLFLKDPNCGCIDPMKDLTLNPAAWTNPAEGTFGMSAAYSSDYRWQRRPSEQASLAKVTKIREGMTLEVRAQFFNIFNRLNFLPNPSSTNFQATTVRDANGVLSSGFGYISISSIGAGQDRKLVDLPFPRTGQLIVRLRF